MESNSSLFVLAQSILVESILAQVIMAQFILGWTHFGSSDLGSSKVFWRWWITFQGAPYLSQRCSAPLLGTNCWGSTLWQVRAASTFWQVRGATLYPKKSVNFGLRSNLAKTNWGQYILGKSMQACFMRLAWSAALLAEEEPYETMILHSLNSPKIQPATKTNPDQKKTI